MATNNNLKSNRLMRDILEFYRDPYTGISLHYSGKYIPQKWCSKCLSTCLNPDKHIVSNVNMPCTSACLIITPESGAFENIPLHFDLEIPTTFPNYPPTIYSSTTLRHPYFGYDRFCLEILEFSGGAFCFTPYVKF
ncbi:hypothetical protein HK096_008083 [Nowakowskiella sp. JEL0078]|nr:hypothetical protein HK096_008083 [Nowakowskiella sp. JEL0078]